MILNWDLLDFRIFIGSLKIGRAPGSVGKRERPNASAWFTNWRTYARKTRHSKTRWSSWEPKLLRRMSRMILIQNRTNLPETLLNNRATYTSKWSNKRARPQISRHKRSSVLKSTGKISNRSSSIMTPTHPERASYKEYRRLPMNQTITNCNSTRNFSVNNPMDLWN